MTPTKWPKILPTLTTEQKAISDDFMKLWHQELGSKARYSLIEKFNHNYPVQHAPQNFCHTLEIGAGLGEHLNYEKLTPTQKKNYIALDIRENMAAEIRIKHPEVQTLIGDCQNKLPYADNYFDRILAIHVLEHLPNLPATVKELHRLCNKQSGYLSIVIPCEGGLTYNLARLVSGKRIFEKRYKQSYNWFIEREHINLPHEIFEELAPFFTIEHKRFFPLVIPVVDLNLCIGITLRPRAI